MKGNNNKDWKNVLIIILSIIALTLCGLIIYLYVNINKTNNQVVNNLVTIINPKYSITDASLGEIVISKEGDVYWFDTDVKSNEIGNKLGVKGTYEVDGYNNPGETKFEGYKLNVSNIASAYFFATGNGGIGYDLVLIDLDHNASIVHIIADYQEELITDVEYKNNVKVNIVSAMNTFTHNTNSYCLIDENGNKYLMN